MKTLFRILIVGAFFAIFFYYTNTDGSDKILQSPEPVIKPIENIEITEPSNSIYDRPTEGISTLIGQPTSKLQALYGEPDVQYSVVFSYDVWIYNAISNYMAVGVKDGVVKQVYTNSETLDISPYKMNTPAADIYASTVLEAEITVKIDDNVYIFSMSEEDTLNRILVKLDTIYAQLYIDEKTEKLVGVRFLDGETLVENKPYEMQFIGELIEAPAQTSQIMLQSQLHDAEQLMQLINTFRVKYARPLLETNEQLNDVASSLSERRYNNELEEIEIDHRDLTKLLDKHGIIYDQAEEIVAIGYLDPIEAVHGLLNSDTHRKVILNGDASEIGIGNYGQYYTQIVTETKVQ